MIDLDSNWRFLKGEAEASSPDPTTWRGLSFADSGWALAPAPFWYGETQLTPGTELTDMRNGYTCVFLRRTFTVSNVNDVGELILEAASDDGFVAWINGTEVVRFNMPDEDAPHDGSSSPALGETSPWPPLTPYELLDPQSFLIEGGNVLAIQAFNSSLGSSSDFVINAALSSTVDETPPSVVELIPPATALVRSLVNIEVGFSEAVGGVDPEDLLINNTPATGVTQFSPDRYVFEFPEPPPGTVEVRWAGDSGIQDLAGTPNPFAGGSWTYALDPNAPLPGVIISEFMADNEDTFNDEDGDSSDWIELHNTGDTSVSLNGWYLTDDVDHVDPWRIPDVSLAPGAYLLLYASGKNRTDPGTRLHTDFRLARSGGYLALLDFDLEVVSAFDPAYPVQYEDVAYGRDRFAPDVQAYFLEPTPGTPNSSGGPGFAPPVSFSRPGGTFVDGFSLTLTTPSSSAVIRYTLDGTVPTSSSQIHSSPIPITGSTEVRARAFDPALIPGPPHTAIYIQLAPSVLNFTSDLPLVILHNFGGGSVPASYDQPGGMAIFEPTADGRSSLTNAPEMVTRIGFNLRGRSTGGYPKSSYAVETWGEADDDEDKEVLGMPAESDWVFYAPNSFDKSLIHNPFIHQVSRDVGRYSSRFRLVEVFVNTTGGAIAGPAPLGDYRGIYVVMEKVKRSADRVDVARLEPEHTEPPTVTGGYLMKIGRSDSDERRFSAADASIIYQYPDGLEMETPQRAAQASYIRDYFNDFYDALTGPDPTDPTTGYPAYIDTGSWVDHHILNVLALNVDALRLSAYFFKNRDHTIEMGPLWDFDRSMGTSSLDMEWNSEDRRAFNPISWMGSSPFRGSDYGTDFFNRGPWYGELSTHADFWQEWIDRYQELRDGPLATIHLFAVVDELIDQLMEAQPRDEQRWDGTGSSDVSPRQGTVSAGGYSHSFPGTYQGEFNFLKRWLWDRVQFMDTNFLARPMLTPGGPIDPGTSIALSGPASATLYYTLDGTDPRSPGGGVAPGAQSFAGSRTTLTLNDNARLVVRARDLAHQNLTGSRNPPISSPWSGVAAATYVAETPQLVVTELMYHPSPPPEGSSYPQENLEYLEVLNRGATSLNLNGFRFSEGIEFVFPALDLAPGERAVVVRDQNAFTERYGSSATIAGAYDSQLANEGERLVLQGPLGEPILDFRYRDDWHPSTDGHGFSLVLSDENTALTNWNQQAQWRPSNNRAGSPALPDGPAPSWPAVRVNEALTHTDLPQVDTIELVNTGTELADISGWLLTDELDQPIKYRFPDNTTIPADGFLLVAETNWTTGIRPFRLSSLGDDIYLFSADVQTNLTGFVTGVGFGAAANGVSFGHHVNSVGDAHFVPQLALSLEAANFGPEVGPVVINELMIEPISVMATNQNFRDEYIELRNLTAQPVPLYDPLAPTNTWRLRGGVDFEFPENVEIPANGHLLVVSFDPVWRPVDLNAFRQTYNLSPDVTVVGPYRGHLDNAGETVRLQQPDPPQTIPGPDFGKVPYVLVEEVAYGVGDPWPDSVAGNGQSLQRRVGEAYGNDPANWQAAVATPGVGYLQCSLVADDEGRVWISFVAGPSRTYTIEYTSDLVDGSWTKLGDVLTGDQTENVTMEDPAGLAAGQRYYRVVAPAQP